MRAFKRTISFALSAVMLMTIFFSAVSCKKKAFSGKTISETDPWYTTKRIELDPDFSPEKYERVYPYVPWKYQDKYVMQYITLNKIDASQDLYTQSAMSSLMGIFDQDGTLLQMIDLNGIASQIGRISDLTVLSLNEGQKGIRVYFGKLDVLDAYSCEVDPETGDLIGSIHQFDFSSLKLNNGDERITYYLSYITVIEGYEIIHISNADGGKDTIVVARDGKVLYSVDFDKELGLGEMKYIKSFFGGGNGTVLFNGFGKTSLMVSLDLATGKVTRLSDANAISENQRLSTGSDGKGYLSKATGIYEYDALTGKEVLAFDFDNCNVNRYESQKASVLELDENKAVLGYFEPVENDHSLSCPTVIYVLEKAQTNPNAGKAVLTCASLGDSLTYFEGAALKAFNDQNTDYFAKLILYDQREIASSEDKTANIDESDRQMYSAKSMVSGSLASDIRSGNGPDVIFGAAQSTDVLDSKYLLDLQDHLKEKNFDRSAYYTNLIDAAMMDGKTFFIPTSFMLTCIVTDGSKIPADQKGFTYEQYGSFVSEQCIGIEPVTEEVSRMHFLNMCIERNYAGWIKENRMNFDQEGFRELMVFFKDSIPEGVSETENAEENQMDMLGIPPAPKEAYFSEEIDSVAALAHINCYGDKLRIMGLPSADGTGPSANITTSFSITKNTEVKEGAYALLDFMLSEEVQKEVRSAIPVNRAAVTFKVEKEKENNLLAYTELMETPESLVSEDSFREGSIFTPDSKIPDIFLQSLEEVHTILLSDNAVMMIVSEEVPAYLLGQKDLNTVITTINNRTQTVFNER